MKIAVLQTKVLNDTIANIEKASTLVQEAAANGANMAMLPEMFTCPYVSELFRPSSFDENSDEFSMIANIAKENSVYLIAGTVPELSDDGNVYNTAYVFDSSGKTIAKHRKTHLFDVNVEGGISFKESATLSPGSDITVFDTDFGKMGLMVCFDIRFPEMARLLSLRGAKLIFVPAAFNMTTGPAHWELTFRARALDNQVFMAGCSPARDMEAAYRSFANSIVTEPWGSVVARAGEDEQILYAYIDFDKLSKVREELPLLKLRRSDLY